MSTRARRFHLGAMLTTFVVAGLAVAGWLESRLSAAEAILVWFLAAIVLHDLVFLPLYSLLDRLVFGSGRRAPARMPRAPGSRPPARPYVRIPAILCALLFVVFAPEILRLGDGSFHTASGLHQDVYLSRFLIAGGVLFALSGLAYAVALIRHGAAQPRTRPSPRRSPPAP